MADAPKVDPKDAEIAALKAQLAAKPAAGFDVVALGDAIAAGIAKANAPTHIKALRKNSDGPNGTHLVAPEHRGAHTYHVGASGHVRGNRIYSAGEELTVIDERPARDWVEVKDGESLKAKPSKALPTGRAADRNVG